jgi:hypothetical protein
VRLASDLLFSRGFIERRDRLRFEQGAELENLL